ncbi:SubName: Full=Uncharacterized protein {ECO:0000313/EMBL:KIM24912.1} [Serendipita indica DSM 11827]|nr:SubName: Full=Uncharacterized protein {ECO:0000313/EMBL:KIM24912.1} [Serendipita indica DSM 11827]
MSSIVAHRLLMRSALHAKPFGISSRRVFSRSAMHNLAVVNARGFAISARLASPAAKPKSKTTAAKPKTVKKSEYDDKGEEDDEEEGCSKRKTATTAAKKKAAPKKKKAAPKKEEKAPTPRTDPSLRPPPRRVSALTMFVKRMYPTLQPKPESATAGLIQLTSMWSGMTDAEKKPFEEEAATERVKRAQIYEKWRADLTQGEVRTINEYLTKRGAHKKLGAVTDPTKKRAPTGFVKFYAESMKNGTIDVSKAPAGQRPATYGAVEAAKLWKSMTEAQKAVYKA